MEDPKIPAEKIATETKGVLVNKILIPSLIIFPFIGYFCQVFRVFKYLVSKAFKHNFA